MLTWHRESVMTDDGRHKFLLSCLPLVVPLTVVSHKPHHKPHPRTSYELQVGFVCEPRLTAAPGCPIVRLGGLLGLLGAHDHAGGPGWGAACLTPSLRSILASSNLRRIQGDGCRPANRSRSADTWPDKTRQGLTKLTRDPVPDAKRCIWKAKLTAINSALSGPPLRTLELASCLWPSINMEPWKPFRGSPEEGVNRVQPRVWWWWWWWWWWSECHPHQSSPLHGNARIDPGLTSRYVLFLVQLDLFSFFPTV